jgi:hypothetical protein
MESIYEQLKINENPIAFIKPKILCCDGVVCEADFKGAYADPSILENRELDIERWCNDNEFQLLWNNHNGITILMVERERFLEYWKELS